MMRQTISIVALLLHFLVSAQVVTDGLVGYWPLDQGLENEQIAGHTANISGATLTTDRNGVTNGAYNFDGVDDYIEYGDILDNIFAGANKQFSFSFWSKPSSLDPDGMVISKYIYCNGANRQFGVEFSNRHMRFYHCNSGYGTCNGIRTINQLTTDVWHHIVINYNGSEYSNGLDRIEIYVDGDLETIEFDLNEATTLGDIQDLSASLTFGSIHSPAGGDCGNTAVQYKGLLDEVCLYNRLLTPTEVTSIYQENTDDGLIGYWPFNGNANDASGNGHHGVVNGSPVLSEDRFNIPNQSYEFDGTDDYMVINNFGEQWEGLTISSWVYLNSSQQGSNRSIMHKGSTSEANNFNLYLTGGSANIVRFWVGDYANTHITADSQLEVGQWYHVVGVWSPSKTQIYIDGLLNVERNHSHSISSTILSQTLIGKEAGTSEFFKGKIDEIKVFNRDLIASEITALYNDELIASPTANNFEINDFGIIYTDAKVGINTPTVPQGFQLAVKGGIISDRVKVIVPTDWPDYVFDEDYNLINLEEVADYIQKNNHLPDVPTAQEVEENGNDLGEMDAILLRKIEELTLYTIEQQKQIEAQQQKLKALLKLKE